jgi:hypothetical protein
VFEITATPTPMNNDMRVLSVKGLGTARDVGAKARDLRLGALLAAPKCERSADDLGVQTKSTQPIRVASFAC